MLNSELRRVLPSLVVALCSVLAFTGIHTAAYKDPEPHDIPVGVVGSVASAAQLQAGLDRGAPGGFDVRAYSSESAARSDLLDTEVQGVLVPDASVDRALVTYAFGKSPTDAVVEAFTAASGPGLAVRDLEPLPADDSRGMSPMWTVLGTVVPSMTVGAMLFLLGGGLPARARWLMIGAFAPLAGLMSAVTADVLVGTMSGAFLPLAAASAALAFGVSAAVHGLGRALEFPGIGLAVLVLLLLGQASSGGAVTPLFVPDFFGAVAPWLPTGAGISLLRNVVYFDGAAIAGPLMVLAGWGASESRSSSPPRPAPGSASSAGASRRRSPPDSRFRPGRPSRGRGGSTVHPRGHPVVQPSCEGGSPVPLPLPAGGMAS